MKTFLLMTNFTTHRDGTVQLGNIIADPFRPFKPLSLPPEPLETSVHEDREYGLRYSDSESYQAGVWAQFLQAASVKLSGAVDANESADYTADTLETVTLKHDPTDEQAAERAADPRVSQIMKKGLFGERPVFMITGLKIARGLHRKSGRSDTRQAEASVSASVTDQVAVGASLTASHGLSREETASSETDIVFAYQLHVISRKGWIHRSVSADVYTPKAALLGRDIQDARDEQFEAPAAQLDTLREIARENEDLLIVENVLEMDDECSCVFIA
jgi:hypothetical protein